MLSEKGQKDYQEKKAGLDFLIVFGSMKFGANALKEWGDELFFYRTGIALALWKEQAEKGL